MFLRAVCLAIIDKQLHEEFESQMDYKESCFGGNKCINRDWIQLRKDILKKRKHPVVLFDKDTLCYILIHRYGKCNSSLWWM